MTRDITGADSEHLLDDGWSTPLEASVRGTIRGFIEVLLEEELETALGRARYARLRTAAGERAAAAVGLGNGEPAAGAVPSTGHRHGRRERQVMGSFGAITVAVPRARLAAADGRTTEWVNQTLPAYRRRTREVDALIAGLSRRHQHAARRTCPDGGLSRRDLEVDGVARMAPDQGRLGELEQARSQVGGHRAAYP
jgi:hypothetical protein